MSGDDAGVDGDAGVTTNAEAIDAGSDAARYPCGMTTCQSAQDLCTQPPGGEQQCTYAPGCSTCECASVLLRSTFPQCVTSECTEDDAGAIYVSCH